MNPPHPKRLKIITQDQLCLLWGSEDLLADCDPEEKKLFRYLAERNGRVVGAKELSARFSNVSNQWRELRGRLDQRASRGNAVPNTLPVTLPPETAEEVALLVLGKVGKSGYRLLIRTEHPLVNADVPPPPLPSQGNMGAAVASARYEMEVEPSRALLKNSSVSRTQSDVDKQNCLRDVEMINNIVSLLPLVGDWQEHIACAESQMVIARLMRGQDYQQMFDSASKTLRFLPSHIKGEQALLLQIEARLFRSVALWLGGDGTGITKPQAAFHEANAALELCAEATRTGVDAHTFQVQLATSKAWLLADLWVEDGQPANIDLWRTPALDLLTDVEKVCVAVSDEIGRYDVLNTRAYIEGVWSKTENGACLEAAQECQGATGEARASGLWAATNEAAYRLKIANKNRADEARDRLLTSFNGFKSTGIFRGQSAAWYFDQLVGVAVCEGNYKLAVKLMGVADGLHRNVGTKRTPPERSNRIRHQTKVSERLRSQPQLDALCAEGIEALQAPGGLEHMVMEALR